MSAIQSFYSNYVDLLLKRANLSTLFSVFTFSNPGITENLIYDSKSAPFKADETVGCWYLQHRNPQYSSDGFAPECTSLDAYAYGLDLVEEFRLYKLTGRHKTPGVPQFVLNHQGSDRIDISVPLKAKIVSMLALGNSHDLNPRMDELEVSSGETRIYAAGVYSLARPAGEACFNLFDSYLLESGFSRGRDGLTVDVFRAKEDKRLRDFQVFSVDYVGNSRE